MSQRTEQVAEELRKIISMILIQDLNDARMGFVTITHVEVTNDLRHARVYYSVLGDEQKKEECRLVLIENIGLIRHLAVERINLKFAMDIRFELDRSIDEGFRIDEILKKIKKEKPE